MKWKEAEYSVPKLSTRYITIRYLVFVDNKELLNAMYILR
jgi:hypothetical protein